MIYDLVVVVDVVVVVFVSIVGIVAISALRFCLRFMSLTSRTILLSLKLRSVAAFFPLFLSLHFVFRQTYAQFPPVAKRDSITDSGQFLC